MRDVKKMSCLQKKIIQNCNKLHHLKKQSDVEFYLSVKIDNSNRKVSRAKYLFEQYMLNNVYENIMASG